jgi:hypothetical protein
MPIRVQNIEAANVARDDACEIAATAKVVERWADLAQEVPHDKPGQGAAKYFTWLCRREAAPA